MLTDNQVRDLIRYYGIQVSKLNKRKAKIQQQLEVYKLYTEEHRPPPMVTASMPPDRAPRQQTPRAHMRR